MFPIHVNLTVVLFHFSGIVFELFVKKHSSYVLRERVIVVLANFFMDSLTSFCCYECEKYILPFQGN